ncbi:hypothetical protein [Flavobacterium succinicans]|uniref:hypothetical protein n=1 Tax=Flavobacterium succinicans TaxID=29536 RepID=UPI001113B10E|nr:hypothetical protein [Flavobacterium succinicans]
MKKSYILFFNIIISILISCKKEQAENIQNSKSVEIDYSKSKTKNIETGLNLTDLNDTPMEIDGCSCFFSETENKYRSEKYLIATNLDSIAYISVNGKNMKLYLIERKFDKYSTKEENYTEIFSNEKFRATIEVKIDNTKKRGDEVWWNTGSIKVEDKNGKIQIKKFIGECGC